MNRTENKDKIQIIRKRYYYNNLSPEKQEIYKEKTWKEYQAEMLELKEQENGNKLE